MDFQKITLIGNVGNVEEKRYTQTGKEVTNLSLGVNGKNDNTQWYKLTAWEGLSDLVTKHVEKGDKLYIEGTPSIEVWNDAEGAAHGRIVVNITTIRLLTPKKTSE